MIRTGSASSHVTIEFNERVKVLSQKKEAEDAARKPQAPTLKMPVRRRRPY